MKTKPETAPHGDAALLDLEAELVHEYAEWKAKRIKDDEGDEWGDRVAEMGERFAEMPVHTLSGVAAKLRCLRHLLVNDGALRTDDISLVGTALAGLERVIGARGQTEDGQSL